MFSIVALFFGFARSSRAIMSSAAETEYCVMILEMIYRSILLGVTIFNSVFIVFWCISNEHT